MAFKYPESHEVKVINMSAYQNNVCGALSCHCGIFSSETVRAMFLWRMCMRITWWIERVKWLARTGRKYLTRNGLTQRWMPCTRTLLHFWISNKIPRVFILNQVYSRRFRILIWHYHEYARKPSSAWKWKGGFPLRYFPLAPTPRLQLMHWTSSEWLK